MKSQNRAKYRGTPPHGYFALKPGTIVRVKPCFGGYPLPPGLNEGDPVRILSFHYGYYQVTKDGRQFEINQTNVE
jgi:hypothetical protein